MLELNDLLVKAGIDPATTVVMFHRPTEPALRRIMGHLASERPDLYNAYQRSHSDPNVEASLAAATHLASCINLGDGTIIFVGIYEQHGWTQSTLGEIVEMPLYRELRELGVRADADRGRPMKWFELRLIEPMRALQGRLLLARPPGRGFRRLARTTTFPVLAIFRDNALSEAMPDWDELVLAWNELSVLPQSWRARLSEWRGIYLITDTSDGKQYVGSAYGATNILGRWRNYAETGHGTNRDLMARDPAAFRFSILQRLSPDLDPEEVIRIESRWKARLLTRELGLNAN